MRVRNPPPLPLLHAQVSKIHAFGGTVLGSDRGGHDVDVILRFCAARGVNQLYIIGGDGTHRGAQKVFEEAARRQLPLAVAAIPKVRRGVVCAGERKCGRRKSLLPTQCPPPPTHTHS